MSPTLAERLKTDTRELHHAAERRPLMGALLRGRLARPDYASLLRNLHAVYAVLEPALASHAARPMIAAIWSPALQRTAAIEQDLLAVHGPSWRTDLALVPTAVAYARRLQEIALAQPELLVAHAYVRYLGDLSGGQVLLKVVSRGLASEGEHITAFYEFGSAEQTAELTRAFRAGLVSLAPGEALLDAIVAEARLGFEFHHALFDEIADASASFTPANAA